MNDLNQRRSWKNTIGLVVSPRELMREIPLLPLGFFLELGLILVLSHARPVMVPRLMKIIWPETARV